MALFSELDWIILLGVGGFLLFGQGSGPALRELGRWYGRAMRLKQELLAEFTAAAQIPAPTPGVPYSLRQALLEGVPEGGRVSGIPMAVAHAPAPAVAAAAPPAAPIAFTVTSAGPVAGGLGPESWSFARPAPELGGVR